MTPHAGNRLALEVAAGLVRVDDDLGIRQHNGAVDHRRQVVVGHQHLQAECAGGG